MTVNINKKKGVEEIMLQIESHRFKIIDVPGLKSSQAKYVHLFDSVSAVLYVISLSSFNEVMNDETENDGIDTNNNDNDNDNDKEGYLNESNNALIQGIQTFKEFFDHRMLKNTAFIVFLNKKDIFAQKIETMVR